MKLTSVRVLCVAALFAFGCKSTKAAEQKSEKPAEPVVETVRVAIGTQDTTINCAAGGPIVRELKLLEKYLPREGRYKSVKYDIQWENQPTGAQLNSKYLANQLDIVQMADFPSVLGATALKAAGDKVQSFYISTLSAGINGAGNAILVPSGSKVQSLSELKGKKISVPFGSTAHAMLIRALQDLKWDPNRDVEIVTQTPEVGGSALKANQIDAHANFVPFGELFPFRGFAKKISGQYGIGYYTWEAYTLQKYPSIVLGMVAIGILGMGSSFLVRAVGRRFMPWVRSERSSP